MEKNKTRCFIAIDLPREVIKEVERVQEEIKKKNIFTGKFTEGENLHLTLKFLGEVSEGKISEVRKKLSGVEMNEFEASLGSVGVFSPRFIKIIWVKILGKDIYELQKKIDDVLSEVFRPEDRFMGHLTIARVSHVKERKLFLEKLKKISVGKMNFKVDGFLLIKSELRPGGPVYSILKKYPLGI